MSLFPLGNMLKKEVRDIAKDANLVVHNKKDSTGICFIGKRNFKTFISKYLPKNPGPIKTDCMDIIGQHDGLFFYTLGQREGLGIGGVKNYPEAPWYVIEKQVEDNALILSQNANHPKLLKNTLHIETIEWIKHPPNFPFECTCKIRHQQTEQECTLSITKNHLFEVHFKVPQRAITPGQYACFYQDEYCLGGGVIIA